MPMLEPSRGRARQARDLSHDGSDAQLYGREFLFRAGCVADVLSGVCPYRGEHGASWPIQLLATPARSRALAERCGLRERTT
jgi:hypothetical protein